jgi:glucosamine--fructose-6-phosphate aminotransferase (isomerizing)
MCGIIGYVGNKPATPLLMEGLKALEYRGYDSAGLTVQNRKLTTVRSEGNVAQLEQKVGKFETSGTCGIAHTRWATHGIPQEKNAHPHRDCTGRVAIVHNGIIENYQELKERLLDAGHAFASDTDSEVFAHLIEQEVHGDSTLFAAVKKVLALVRGTYGLVVITQNAPQTLIAARMGSPLVIGIGEGEHYIASDPSAIMNHTKDVLYLDDGEIAAVTSEGISLDGVEHSRLQNRVLHIDWDVETSTKAGYPHFMLKEIFEQPEVIENSIRGRVDLLNGRCVLGGLQRVEERLREIDRVVIVGCGSAYYAGLVGEYLFEQLVRIPVEVELASEFRYRKPLLTTRTAVLAISQSGETADTLEAVREAKRKNALSLGLVNVVGSSIARETDAGVYNHAGPEVGVASTKAFVSQLTVLTLMAVYLGQLRGTSTQAHEILTGVAELPEQVQSILNQRSQITKLAHVFSNTEHCLFLGRSLHAPIAYEGALKVKEVSYVHAEGYSSGEMKHGPIALIHEGFPCVVLCPNDSLFEKNWSNIQELQSRGGRVIAVTTSISTGLSPSDQIIVPQTHEALQPILSMIPLQLLAYEVALARNVDPDKPRNLAKSVTVE